MNCFLALLLLLDVSLIEANMVVKQYGQFTLGFEFPSHLNSFKKSCGKFYAGKFQVLLDSFGFRHEILRGRVAQLETSSLIQFQISKVRLEDGGYYRCFVGVTYMDFIVEVIESTNPYILPQTTETIYKNKIFPSSAEPALTTEGDASKFYWSSSGWRLASIVAAAVILAVVSIMSLACFIVRWKRSKSDKVESTAVANKDFTGIVYTTVDFKAKDSELYVNLTQEKACDTSLGEGDVVEYSTLAVHHRL